MTEAVRREPPRDAGPDQPLRKPPPDLADRDPANPTTLGNLGYAYWTAGRFDEAIVSNRKVLQLSPGRPLMHANIATCLIAKGDPRAALAEMQLESTESAWRKIGFPAVWHALGEHAKAR